jgi:pimeloyl-ACP methyl ester carboxylesterase
MHRTDNNFRLHWPYPTPAAADGTTATKGHQPKRAVAPRRWLRATGVLASAAVGLVAAVVLVGAAYESIAGSSDASRYPPTGRLVDVGGYQLHLDCRGEGSPTVVMDAGLGGSSLDWALVQDELATTTKVCTYDRAGMGWSDTGPGPRTPKHIADELWALLNNAGLKPPFVMVAHSLAGKNARMFALAHPHSVTGMVLVDARSEYVDANTSKADADAFSAAIGTQATVYTVARRIGVARLFGASLADQPLVKNDVATEMVLLQTQPAAVSETVSEGLARAADDATLANSKLGSMPLAVIVASDSLQNTPNWPAAQKQLSQLSTAGELVIAQNSGHYVQLEQPNVVIDTVRTILARIRNAI